MNYQLGEELSTWGGLEDEQSTWGGIEEGGLKQLEKRIVWGKIVLDCLHGRKADH